MKLESVRTWTKAQFGRQKLTFLLSAAVLGFILGKVFSMESIDIPIIGPVSGTWVAIAGLFALMAMTQQNSGSC